MDENNVSVFDSNLQKLSDLENQFLNPGLPKDLPLIDDISKFLWVLQNFGGYPKDERINGIGDLKKIVEKGGSIHSLQLSFVFKDAFADSQKQFIERTIREETPAHLIVHVQWLDDPDFATFSSEYQTWADSLNPSSP